MKLIKGDVLADKYEIFSLLAQEEAICHYIALCDKKKILLKVYDLSKTPPNFYSDDNIPWEIANIKSLTASFLPQIIDHAEYSAGVQKYYYVAYALISGELLSEKLQREGFLGYYQALPIINQVLDIVSYLHSQNPPIIHNNINPNTIWLDYSTGVERVILDGFQYSRNMKESRKSLSPIDLNMNYIAPELFNRIFLPQSDIFSVGAVLYKMICGIPPYYIEYDDARQFHDVFEKKNNLWENNLDLNVITGETLDENQKYVIYKALESRIDERFQDVDIFKRHLNREVALGKVEVKGGYKTLKDRKYSPKREGTGFDRIAGMSGLKDLLYNDVIRALEEKELYLNYGLTIPNGLLLFGPPGCGKTFFAECFAEEIGYNFVYNNPSDVKSKWINETEEKIASMFKEAQEQAPTILYFDEISSLIPSRDYDLHHMHSSAVEEFLAQMTNCGDKGVFILASTNYPEKIDPAFLRAGRIDKKYYIPPPDVDARSGIFEIYLKKRPIDLAVDYLVLANSTQNYVSSDIKFIVDEASRIALREKQKITMENLLNVISRTPPSVSVAILEKYDETKNKFQKNDDLKTNVKPKIGF